MRRYFCRYDAAEQERYLAATLNGQIEHFNRTYTDMGKDAMRVYLSKNDEAHLYKHAMHLIRLLITGVDILHGRGIVTYREKEHELLMDIRNGRYTFDEIFDMTEDYQHSFDRAAKETDLPERPDIEKVESLMREIYVMAQGDNRAQ